MDAYQALLLLSLQEDTDSSDMGGTYIGLFEDKKSNSKWHLITAPNIFMTSCKWQIVNLNFNQTDSIDGYNNCHNLIDLENYPAIEYCINFSFNQFSDYYLPSIYELRFINKKASVLQNNFYWSSTECDELNCYTHTDNLISQKNKLENAVVHPVRRIVLR